MQRTHTFETCRSVCDEHCFEIIDQASNYYYLQIKEALHIHWEKPSLNVQVKHYQTCTVNATIASQYLSLLSLIFLYIHIII